MRVLVIGGTGNVGSHVVQKLIEKGTTVRCLARTTDKLESLPEGVEGCVANLEKPKSLDQAFDGIDTTFLITPISQNETTLGINAIEAAVKNDTEKLVYMSVALPAGSEIIPHFKSKIPIEEALKESGLKYSILRPNNFFQNDFMFKDSILNFNSYPQPIGMIGLNRVDVRDIAECSVNALTQSKNNDKIFDIHGTSTLNGIETAEILSRNLNRQIYYQGDNLNTWAEQARNLMPQWMVDDFKVMYRFFQENGFRASIEQIEQTKSLLGRDQRTYDSFTRELAKAWIG